MSRSAADILPKKKRVVRRTRKTPSKDSDSGTPAKKKRTPIKISKEYLSNTDNSEFLSSLEAEIEELRSRKSTLSEEEDELIFNTAAASANSSFNESAEEFFASILPIAPEPASEELFDLNIRTLFDSIHTKTSNIKNTLRKQHVEEVPDLERDIELLNET